MQPVAKLVVRRVSLAHHDPERLKGVERVVPRHHSEIDPYERLRRAVYFLPLCDRICRARGFLLNALGLYRGKILKKQRRIENELPKMRRKAGKEDDGRR